MIDTLIAVGFVVFVLLFNMVAAILSRRADLCYEEQKRRDDEEARRQWDAYPPFAASYDCPTCGHHGEPKMESAYSRFGFYIVRRCAQCGQASRMHAKDWTPGARPHETHEQAAQREVDEIAPDA